VKVWYALNSQSVSDNRPLTAARAGRLLAAGALAFALVLLPARASDARGRVAVVVHKSNPVDDVSSAELRRILLGDESRWSGKDKITILLLAPGSQERQAILKALLRMSDDDFVRHWISRVFQGDATAGPKIASSPISLVKLVAGLPAALGIVDADDVPPANSELKILRVDGKAPADAGYEFVASARP
jgi:ABC-type phosphate transport system substrate-binding protein